jgi:hypothetical protein
MGEQPLVAGLSSGPVVADTFAGHLHVEWDKSATVTPLGQLPFFIEYLQAAVARIETLNRARAHLSCQTPNRRIVRAIHGERHS